MRVQTPQAYRFGLIHQAYQTAKEKGITDCVYANTLLIELGETLYFAVGSEKNLKITNPEDLEMFKSLLALR